MLKIELLVYMSDIVQNDYKHYDEIVGIHHLNCWKIFSYIM